MVLMREKPLPLEKIVEGLSANPPEQIAKTLEIVKDMQKKLDDQGELITKIAVCVSKLYQDGTINQKTFDTLDVFLKPYYDDSNLAKDY